MKAKRIILATGSREVDDYNDAFGLLWDWLQFEVHLFGLENVLVVHGLARGWDSVYDDVANALGIHVRGFKADWDTHGKRAGALRNVDMIRFVTGLSEKYPSKPACWAHARAWDSGTGHCARAARKAGIPTTDFGAPTV